MTQGASQAVGQQGIVFNQENTHFKVSKRQEVTL
jgi:hypothetical protein